MHNVERQKWVGTIQDSEFQNTNTKGEAGRTPQISVIMPVYNGEKYIARAVQSVYGVLCDVRGRNRPLKIPPPGI